ncbi:MAG: SCO family protein [Deltaproteobacteria bacterium]|nr:SCO family protein [Deltaproteobacteria bacterium]
MMPYSRLVIVLAFLLAAACQRAEPTGTFVGRGVVKEVLPQERQVVIAHEDIPGFMKAMTMGFEVKEDSLLEGIGKGEEVAFTIEKTKDSLYLTALAPAQESAEALPRTEPEAPTEAEGVIFPEPVPAPDFTLTDQGGHPVQLSSLRGRVVLLDFIYTTCPGPCPILSRKFAQLQRQLGDSFGKEIVFLSITVDPQHDTPAVLKEYARRYQADTSGWKFLTGSTSEIINVTFQYGVDYYGESGGEINHLVATYIIDRVGNVVKMLKGPNHTVAELLAEVQRLLNSAKS